MNAFWHTEATDVFVDGFTNRKKRFGVKGPIFQRYLQSESASQFSRSPVLSRCYLQTEFPSRRLLLH